MTIREFVRTLWKGKYLVLSAVLIVVLGAVVYLDRQDPEYSATATAQLMTAASPLEASQEINVTVATSNDDVTSAPVAAAAAAALGYAGAPEALAATVSVAPGSEDGLFVNIMAVSGDADEAVTVANAFATAYVAQLSTLRAEQVAAIDAQKATLSGQLEGVRERLLIDATDPLAIAEQGAIVAGYQALVTQANVLLSIDPPGVLDTPAVSASLVGPSRGAVVAVAVLAGLLAGIGLAFARRGLDLRVRSAPEAVQLTGVPILAELTGVRTADRRFRSSQTLPVPSKVATPFTESIRELRTAVQVALSDVRQVVVVVTATDPRAPRSFVVANLAASFALSGRRTIAVSGDLRRPELDGLLPAPASWSGPAGELRPTLVPNLSVFPMADDEMDPADYLASTRARSLMDRLRASAEVVVVDAPPVLAAADATILGGYADGTVLITSVGQTDRAVLTEAVSRLLVNNVPVVGLALAGVRGNRRMHYASTYGEAQPSGKRRTPDTPGTPDAMVPRGRTADGASPDGALPGSAHYAPALSGSSTADSWTVIDHVVADEAVARMDPSVADVVVSGRDPEVPEVVATGMESVVPVPGSGESTAPVSRPTPRLRPAPPAAAGEPRTVPAPAAAAAAAADTAAVGERELVEPGLEPVDATGWSPLDNPHGR